MIIESRLKGLRKGEAEETKRVEGGAGKAKLRKPEGWKGRAEEGEAEETERVEGGAEEGEAEETGRVGRRKPKRKMPTGARVR